MCEFIFQMFELNIVKCKRYSEISNDFLGKNSFLNKENKDLHVNYCANFDCNMEKNMGSYTFLPNILAML